MSRASSSDHQKLRIAVAMVALVHKPPAQSVDSYIIDLRTKFSTSGCDSEHTWRNRALWLEKRLQETVHILQRERAKSQIQAGKSSSSPEHYNEDLNVALSRKRRRLEFGNSKEPLNLSRWTQVLTKFHSVFSLPSLEAETSILVSILRIKRSRITEHHDLAEEVLPLVKRCLDSAGKRLRDILTENVGPGSQQGLEYLILMIPGMIKDSLLCVGDATKSLDKADTYVRTVYSQLLHPIICFLNLDSCVSGRNALSMAVDPRKGIRTMLLNLCLGILQSLNEEKQIIISLSITMAYSALQRLKDNHTELVSALSIRYNGQDVPQDQLLEKQILFKETFWYLTTIVNTCLSVSSVAGGQCPDFSPLEQIVKNKFVASLMELLQQDDDTRQFGLVERNMLLAGVEKAWLNGWFTTAVP